MYLPLTLRTAPSVNIIIYLLIFSDAPENLPVLQQQHLRVTVTIHAYDSNPFRHIIIIIIIITITKWTFI